MRKNCITCKHDRLRNPICDECYNTSDAPTKWEASEYYVPDTNAECIRAMGDEELAEWIVKKTKYQESAWSEPSYLNFLTGSDDTMESAINGTLEWLKQPAE